MDEIKIICKVCGKVIYAADPKRLMEPVCDKCMPKYKEDLIRTNREEVVINTIPPLYLSTKADENKIDKCYGKNLCIYGNTGYGKTVLMAALAKKYIMSGRRVEWVDWPLFMLSLKSSINSKTDSVFDRTMNLAKTKKILMLDDIYAGTKQFSSEILYVILDYREKYKLPYLLTSNVKLSEIDDGTDRLASRIAGKCEIVTLAGKDERLIINDHRIK